MPRDYTAPNSQCPRCGGMLRLAFSQNQGVAWFHVESRRVPCNDGVLPETPEPTKDDVNEFILNNQWCGLQMVE